MTPILGKPCSYDSASHNQSADVDDWSQSSGPGLFDFEDRESMDSLQLLARASKTNGRRKKKVTQRAKYNLLKGGFVNCLTKKSSKRMPFDVRTTQELRNGHESSHCREEVSNLVCCRTWSQTWSGLIMKLYTDTLVTRHI